MVADDADQFGGTGLGGEEGAGQSEGSRVAEPGRLILREGVNEHEPQREERVWDVDQQSDQPDLGEPDARPEGAGAQQVGEAEGEQRQQRDQDDLDAAGRSDRFAHVVGVGTVHPR